MFLIISVGCFNAFSILLIKGLYADAHAAMDYLIQRSDISQDKIVIFGRSLGGAVAIYLANQMNYRQHIMCLIVENTFTSLPKIAGHLFNFKLLHMLPIWAYKNKVRTFIDYLRYPLTFLQKF